MDIVIITGAVGAVVSAVFATLYYYRLRKRENPDIEMGFAKGGQIVDTMEIKLNRKLILKLESNLAKNSISESITPLISRLKHRYVLQDSQKYLNISGFMINQMGPESISKNSQSIATYGGWEKGPLALI